MFANQKKDDESEGSSASAVAQAQTSKVRHGRRVCGAKPKASAAPARKPQLRFSRRRRRSWRRRRRKRCRNYPQLCHPTPTSRPLSRRGQRHPHIHTPTPIAGLLSRKRTSGRQTRQGEGATEAADAVADAFAGAAAPTQAMCASQGFRGPTHLLYCDFPEGHRAVSRADPCAKLRSIGIPRVSNRPRCRRDPPAAPSELGSSAECRLNPVGGDSDDVESTRCRHVGATSDDSYVDGVASVRGTVPRKVGGRLFDSRSWAKLSVPHLWRMSREGRQGPNSKHRGCRCRHACKVLKK